MLKVSCSMDASPGKPFIKGKGEQKNFDIAGVIGLTSEKFTGTITLCFPENVYLKLMSSMLGEEFKEVTPELQDGAAEFLNMIFGQAKVVLNQQGHTLQKAIPTVVRGKAIETTHMGGSPVLVIPFQMAAGEFYIEIAAQE